MNIRYRLSLWLFGLLLMCGGTAKGQATAPVAGPEEGEARDTVVFRFAPDRQVFWRDYENNEASIETLTQQIRNHRTSIEAGTLKVCVQGFCAAYGSEAANLTAAKDRSNQVKSYFIVEEGLVEDDFRTTNFASAWQGATDVIALAWLSPMAAPAEVAQEDEAPAVVAEAAPAEKTAVRPAPKEKVAPRPAAPVRRPEPVRTGNVRSDRWAIKTNVAYLAATVANIGIEYAFGNNFSVDFPIVYSPYTVAQDYRLRFLAIQPEFRYWLCRPLRGHFFGVHLNVGAFNVSVDNKIRYQSPDGYYGVGVSYGYMVPIARHWSAEFAIGAGYVYTKYDTYYNISNGARFEKGIPYHYWGLTKVGVSLVYRF